MLRAQLLHLPDSIDPIWLSSYLPCYTLSIRKLQQNLNIPGYTYQIYNG